MDAKTPQHRESRWPTSLEPHELYYYLPWPSQAEIDLEREKLKSHSPTKCIEVIGDKVVFGLTTFLAADTLGLTEIEVMVREDMGKIPEAVVGLHILKGFINAERVDPFRLAELYTAWIGWKMTLPRCRRGRAKREAIDQSIDEALTEFASCDRRTLERYRAALALPTPIVNAMRQGQLPITLAPRIIGLSSDDRLAIADQIQNGKAPSEAVNELITQDAPGPQSLGAALRPLFRAARRGLPVIEAREQRAIYLNEDDLEIARRLENELREILRLAPHAKREHKAAEAEFASMVASLRKGATRPGIKKAAG